ncbi:MAG: hypothetical protein U1A77_23750 [Pirellulales bacterium]
MFREQRVFEWYRVAERSARRLPAMGLLALTLCLAFAPSPSFAQTLGLAPFPYLQDDCGKVQATCCPGPLVWGFDPWGGCDHCSECFGDCRTGFMAHRPSTWYASVNAVALTPDRNEDAVLATLGPGGATVLSTGDLESEYGAGGRITVGRTLGACYQMEFVYQGNHAWNDNAVAASVNPEFSSILSGFANPVDPLFDENNLATVNMASRMSTAEINLRTWIQLPPGPHDLQLLVGARYFAANDVLDFSTAGANINTVNVRTDNDLYGVQLGLNSKFLLHRLFFFDFEGKIALCENFAQQSTSFSQNGGAAVVTAASPQRTSLLGELMLVGVFQVTPNIAIRGGYQAIFVDGLALGPQNVPSNAFLLQNGVPQFRDDGEMIYHGPTLGLVGTW